MLDSHFDVSTKEPDVSGQIVLSSGICIACSLETHKAVAKSIASLRGVSMTDEGCRLPMRGVARSANFDIDHIAGFTLVMKIPTSLPSLLQAGA